MINKPAQAHQLDPWLSGEKVRPWQYPELTQLHASGRVVTILVDANVIIRDLKTTVKRRLAARQPDAPPAHPTAFFELLGAPHARIFASAEDFTVDARGWTRLERNVLDKEKTLSLDMVRLFRLEVYPHLWVLDAAGLPDTSRSLEVQGKDRGDSGLAKLGHLLNPDAFLTYDGQAFGNLSQPVHVLKSDGEHGQLLCAIRDDLRVQEFTSLMFLWPLSLGGQLLQQASRSLHGKGVHYVTQALLVGGVLGLLYWRYLALREQLHEVAKFSVRYYQHFQPTAEERVEMRRMMALTQVHWDEPAGSGGWVVRVGRQLSRSEGLSATDLCALEGWHIPAGELSRYLSAWPGVFERGPYQRWRLRSPQPL